MTITMYDSVEPSQFPADPQAVAGYVGGRWPDYSQLVTKFPRALHKSIAISASEDADILDVESGDAVPSQAPGWVKRQHARGLSQPGVYSAAFEMPQVLAALNNAGIKRNEYVVWLAHVTNTPPSPPFEQGADAVQYTFTALGRNLDASICKEVFFGNPPVPVVNKAHYERFPVNPFLIFGNKLSERHVVQVYDKYRALQTKTKHPDRIRLALLRKYLKWLAGRVYRVAHKHPRNGKPSWGVDYRGWRYQQLLHRSQGQRFV